MGKEKLCTTCGTVAKPKRIMKGSIYFEILLWACALLPGFLYTIWQHAAVYYACTKCGSRAVIPLDTPRARDNLFHFP